MTSATRRRLLVWLFVFWAMAVAWLTLIPGSPIDALTVRDFLCVWCSSRPAADRILNVALFVPAGFLLARLVGTRAAILSGVAMTLGIEAAQVAIPGRHPALADILTNASGAVLGAGLATWPARRVLALGGVTASIAWLLPAALLVPHPGAATLYGLWNPDFPGQPVYSGEVLSAEVGGVPVLGRLEASDVVRDALAIRGDVEVTFIAAADPRVATSVFGIWDEDQREHLRVAVRGDDVTLSWRSLATVLGLDQPDHIAEKALDGVVAGDTVTLRLSHEDGRWCLQAAGRRDCRLSPSQASGWAFLMYPDGTSTFVRDVFSRTWGFGLGIAVGAAAPGAASAILAGIVLGGVGLAAAALAPELAPAIGPTLSLLLGTLAGIAIRPPVIAFLRPPAGDGEPGVS